MRITQRKQCHKSYKIKKYYIYTFIQIVTGMKTHTQNLHMMQQVHTAKSNVSGVQFTSKI